MSGGEMKRFLIMGILLVIISSLIAKPIQYPKEAYSIELHGTQIYDDYHWLQDRNDPRVMKYILQENAYSDSFMVDTVLMQKLLMDDFSKYQEINKAEYPIIIGNYTYLSKVDNEGFKNIYRKKNGTEKEELVIDVRSMSQGRGFSRLVHWQISPDQKYVAFTMDFKGNEIGTLYIFSIVDQKLIGDSLENVSHMFFWNDSKTLLYVTREYPFNFKKLYAHEVDRLFSEDQKIYEVIENNGSIDLFADDQFIHFFVSENDSMQAFYQYKHKIKKGFKQLLSKRPANISYLFNEQYIFLIDDQSLSISPINKVNHQRVLRRYDEHTSLFHAELCKETLILFEESEGSQRIYCLNYKTGKITEVKMPDDSYSISNVSRSHHQKDYFDFSYTSLNKTLRYYRYDLKTQQLKLLSETQLKGYQEELYQTEKIYVVSHDQQRIPLTLFYRKDKFKKDGSNPLFLRAYGAYGYSQYPWFESHLISLADLGFVYAVAHVRGGSEMGKQWHTQSIGAGKDHSIKDYISCAELLINQKYTSKGQIAAFGRSAGGRLIAGAVNQKPELFGAAIYEVPACDGLNWMLDRKTDYFNQKEFGDPMNKEDFETYLRIDPYQNVRAQSYPPILLSAAWEDIRVSYWQPLKMTAKLRMLKTDQNPVLIKTRINAGHQGASSSNAYHEDWAFKYAFIMKMLKKEINK